jgi:hypothetical protein
MSCSRGETSEGTTRTTPLLALHAPERTRQNHIRAERDKKRWQRRYDRPDPEREKEELSVLVGRSDRQRMDVGANSKSECSKRNGERDVQGGRSR